MPDKKLTDNDIVKALECCMDEMGCKKGCPCFDPKSKSSHCTAIGDNGLEKLALDLINRLQAENEKLQKFKAYFDFYYGSNIEILGIDENGDTTSFDEFYNCAISDAENIEHHIAHIIKTAKAEAYKEFAERLKKKAMDRYNTFEDQEYPYAIIPDIDNLLKELVGNNNAG